MTSGMFHEPRLFTSGVDLPLEHPMVYTALIDEDAYDFLLVMEDLDARGSRPPRLHQTVVGGPGTPAFGTWRMHGHYWGERVLNHCALGWLEPFVPWEECAASSALERLGDDAPDESWR